MSRKIEVLDQILNEAGVKLGRVKEEEPKTEEVQEAINYEQMDISVMLDYDEILEAAMMDSLRTSIYESDESDDVKIKQLSAIEGVSLSDDNQLKFIEAVIDPIIQASGAALAINEDTTPEYISGVIFETAMTLAVAKENGIEGLKQLKEQYDEYDKILEEQKKAEEAEKDEALEEDAFEDEVVEDEVVEEGTEEEVEEKELTESELLEFNLNRVFEGWGVEDPKQIQLIVDNAENILESKELGSLCIDLHELAEMDLSEATGEFPEATGRLGRNNWDTLQGTVGDAVEPSPKKKVGKGSEGKKKNTPMSEDAVEETADEQPVSKWISGATRRVTEGIGASMAAHDPRTGAAISKGAAATSLSKGTKIGLAVAAAAALAALVWKKTRNPSKVIASLNAAKAKCGTSGSPDKCKAKYDKQIAKWKTKVK